MKQYIAPQHLRLIGKGWEIRHQLKKLAASQPSGLLIQMTDPAQPNCPKQSKRLRA